MRDVIKTIETWRKEGKQVALATVVKVYGSAPRPLGAKMVISSSGDLAGSVSGGCVEGAVVEVAQKCIKTGIPTLVEYGISDDMAWNVGLACGGKIEVFVEVLIGEPEKDSNAIYEQLIQDIRGERYCVVATIISGPGIGQHEIYYPKELGSGNIKQAAVRDLIRRNLENIWEKQKPVRLDLEDQLGKQEVFIDVYPPLEKLIVVGAAHIAIPLVHFAHQLGFHTIVLDARSAFANRERFPHADEVIVCWPAEFLEKMDIDESTYIVVVSHDEKLDNPALQVALKSRARYIGALGSSKTHAKRVATLRDLGFPEESIQRIFAPIGINLGAVGPEEIALSIMSEIVSVRRNVIIRNRS